VTRHQIRDPHHPSRWGVPLAMVVGLAVGLGTGLLVRDAWAAPPAAALAPAQVTRDPSVPATPSSSTASAPPATVAAQTPAPPVSAFLDGGFYVSTAGSPGMVTVAPGRYRSAGATVGGTCVWERRDGSDSVRDQTQAPVTLTLRAGNFFRSAGCAQWVKTN